MIIFDSIESKDDAKEMILELSIWIILWFLIESATNQSGIREFAINLTILGVALFFTISIKSRIAASYILVASIIGAIMLFSDESAKLKGFYILIIGWQVFLSSRLVESTVKYHKM